MPVLSKISNEPISISNVSICGAVDLLAAVYGKDKNLLRIAYGLPTTKPLYHCGNCNKITTNPYGWCSPVCRKTLSTITVICSECQQPFTINKSQLIARTKRNKIEQKYCSRKCHGRWTGRNYGFGVHPEHKRGTPKRKWNHELVLHLRRDTSWGAIRLSRKLNIPKATISQILQNNNLTKLDKVSKGV